MRGPLGRCTRSIRVGPGVYHTLLPMEECIGRLQAATDPWPSFLQIRWSHGKFLLKLHAPSFRISRPDAYRNAFAPHFYGRMQSENGTTIIRGDVRFSTCNLVFFSLLPASLIAVLGPSFLDQFEIEVLLLWAVIALGMWRLGGRLAPGTSEQYGEFIRDVLAAVPTGGLAA
jgi:hypothetical protein